MRCRIQAIPFLKFLRIVSGNKSFQDRPVYIEVTSDVFRAMFQVPREVPGDRVYDPFQFIIAGKGSVEDPVEMIRVNAPLNILLQAFAEVASDQFPPEQELLFFVEEQPNGALQLDIGTEPSPGQFELIAQVPAAVSQIDIPQDELPHENELLGVRFDDLGQVSYLSPKAGIEVRWTLFAVNSAVEVETVLAGLIREYVPKCKPGDSLMSGSSTPPAAPSRRAPVPPPKGRAAVPPPRAPAPPTPPPEPPAAPLVPPSEPTTPPSTDPPVTPQEPSANEPDTVGASSPADPGADAGGGSGDSKAPARRTKAQIEADKLAESLAFLRSRGYEINGPGAQAAVTSATPESLAVEISALAEEIRQKVAQLGGMSKGLMTFEQAREKIFAQLKG